MVKKRGIILILFLVLISISSHAFEESTSDFYSLYHCNNFDENDDFCYDIIRQVSLVSSSVDSFTKCDPEDDNYDFQVHSLPSSDGCWFAAAGVIGDNDNSWSVFKEGAKLTPEEPTVIDDEEFGGLVKNVEYYSGNDRRQVEGDDVDYEVKCFYWDFFRPGRHRGSGYGSYKVNLVASGQAICSSDHMWHECKGGDGGNEGKIVWANNVIYQCKLVDSYYYKWQELGTDKDNDGYIWINNDEDLPPNTARDCDDNPNNNYDVYPFCLDLIDTENPKACSDDVKYAKCAQCINPGMPEICGDLINNDCRGGIFSLEETPFEFADVNELAGRTPDTCNNFKEGCEQLPGKGLSQDGTVIDIPMYNNNRGTLGEKFSWIETGAENSGIGYCCGYNGLEDLGDSFPGRKNNIPDNYICLKKDNNLVGMEGGIETLENYNSLHGEGQTWESSCGTEWCWIGAGNPKFKIMTIKKLGEQAYTRRTK